MTQREGLEELARRCEAATGADRELDCRIWCAAMDAGFSYEMAAEVAPNLTDWLAPTYTASLDAAMTLVAEGWKLRQIAISAPCADDRSWHVNLHGGREGEETFVGRGRTMVLAVLCAALRARATLSEGAGKGEGERG